MKKPLIVNTIPTLEQPLLIQKPTKHSPLTQTEQKQKTSPTLDQILQRSDIWRGKTQKSTTKATLHSGFEKLDQQLLNGGWPLGGLIELFQPSAGHGDWLLFTPAITQLLSNREEHYAVLLNPPALPFSQALLHAKIPLNRLLIIQIRNKADLIASFVELAQASSCCLLMAWQPQTALNYTELRKCQLACTKGKGLYALFRPTRAQQQSSPAVLRIALSMGKETLDIQLLKQRGLLSLPNSPIVQISLPEQWRTLAPHRLLKARSSGHYHPSDGLFTQYQPNRNLVKLNTDTGKRIRLKHQYY